MKRPIKLIGATVLLCAATSCSKEMYQASWQTKPVVADGKPTEWNLPLRFADVKTGLQYNITNDASNIYVCVRATDQKTEMSILSSGMEIQMEPVEKNKVTASVRFPLPGMQENHKMPEPEQNTLEPGKNTDRMDFTRRFQSQDHEIILNGFGPEYNGTFKVSELTDFKAAINWDEQNAMTYELVIPMKALYARDSKSTNSNPVIAFKINLTEMAMGHQGGAPHNGSQGGEGHSGGGHHQGGMGGGMEGGSGGGFSGGHGGGHGGSGMHNNAETDDEKGSASKGETATIKFEIKLSGAGNN